MGIRNKTPWEIAEENYHRQAALKRRAERSCEHGFEAGKNCDICYEEWVKKNSSAVEAKKERDKNHG